MGHACVERGPEHMLCFFSARPVALQISDRAEALEPQLRGSTAAVTYLTLNLAADLPAQVGSTREVQRNGDQTEGSDCEHAIALYSTITQTSVAITEKDVHSIMRSSSLCVMLYRSHACIATTLLISAPYIAMPSTTGLGAARSHEMT